MSPVVITGRGARVPPVRGGGGGFRMIPNTEAGLVTIILVMSRISGIVLVEPFIGNKSIPRSVKALLVLVLSVTLAPLVNVSGQAASLDWMLVLRVGYEVLIGLVIGYMFLVIFLAVMAAGEIIDLEMGFGLSSAIDPGLGVQATVISRFYFFMALVLFLLANGHHLLIKATVGSYEVFPAGSMMLPRVLAPSVLRVFCDVMLMAVQVAGPIIGALVIADVLFGVVARAVPAMNIFVIGFPIKILLGLTAVLVTMPYTVRFLQALFGRLDRLLSAAF